MDKLTAYKVLGLNSDANLDMIKGAYASLSKKYHPEDNPEEFQSIHEAYVILTRKNRNISRLTGTYDVHSFEEINEKYTFEQSEEKYKKQDVNEFDFEESIRKAEEEVERLHEEQERLRLEKEKEEAEKRRIKQENLDKEKERLLEEARQEFARKQEEERLEYERKQEAYKKETSTDRFVILGGVVGAIIFLLIKTIFQF